MDQTKPLIIGVDTGNRCIKTAQTSFLAGITEVATSDGLFRDILTYNDRRYTLTNHRNSYMANKTQSEDYFIMTLFAIKKELDLRHINTDGTQVKVILAVGLPPRDISRLRNAYLKYFSRGQISFDFQEKRSDPIRRYNIDITSVNVFPQGISAIFADYERIKNLPKAYIVDIGGYTTDIIELHFGKIDPTMCRSINKGMIHFYNQVLYEVEVATGQRLDEDQIDRMLETQREIVKNASFVPSIQKAATAFTSDLQNKLFEFGIDLTVNKGIFLGGGSVRLQQFINAQPGFGEPFFILDISANAKGYEALSRAKAW